LLVALALVLGAALAGGCWVRAQLRASLPQLDGSLTLDGLESPAVVTRDALGIPTISAGSREDVARATGFLHAQDRFFQMDLSRRRAAGELAALVGAPALEADREIRVHRFRAVAERALRSMDRDWRSLVDAYTAGVNSGLAALAGPPFEYLMLGQDPQPWKTEDSLLVVLSMFITLQDPDGSYESTLATLHDVLPEPMALFLVPAGTEWDSPIAGPPFEVPPIPGPDVYNLRARRQGTEPIALPPRQEVVRSDHGAWASDGNSEVALGSNNWAVAGRLTDDGRALVANDMHLQVRVPNTWYRAAIEWPDADRSSTRRLIGITLPGVPAVVVGSNTHVAWGFTNSQGDWSDIVLLEVDPGDPTRYRTPDGWRAFDRHEEVIQVAGEPPRHESVSWTVWGPVLPPDHRMRPRALRWVAHDADRLGTSIAALESAQTLEEAFEAVNGLGTPGQNFVAADAGGRIGWTIYGSIPRRVGFDGRLPISWADGSRGWQGWLDAAEYPRIIDPADGRLWTANARAVDGEMLARIGDGNYDVGSRARIIRDRLVAQDRFTAADFLDMQLDTSAAFVSRWRRLLLDTLGRAASNGRRQRLARIVAGDWDGRASAESAGYRLTRMFREQVSEAVIAFVLVECFEADPRFDYRRVRRREGPIWKLVSERPMHLLDPRYDTWEALLVSAADAVIERAEQDGGLDAPWSRWNVTAYRHPLSAGLPLVGRWLDMPFQPLAGDLYTPNMHWGSNAASERMVVSPGNEAGGLLHMPTGQSGHPLSPFYANSHEAWVRGTPAPLLPGPAVHTLRLVP
jgi:penicillin amidase